MAQDTDAPCACGVADPINSTRRGRLQTIYSNEELEILPDTVVDAADGCGNPTAIANLKAGDVVVNLGSGGGIDCFLAGLWVGASGRVIGVDMTPEMLSLARANAKKVHADNVEFRLGELDHLPVLDSSADVIISNCVINLAPDRDAVFAEAFRIIKREGRLAVSDIVFDVEPSDQVRQDVASWARCVGGALGEDEYLAKIRAAGFSAVGVESRSSFDVGGNKVSSVRVVAVKP